MTKTTGRKDDRRRRVPDAGKLAGEVAASLAPDDVGAALDTALALVERHFRADACEVFLEDGERRALRLASWKGRQGAHLASRTTFARGTGWPGIVYDTGRPLATNALDRDRRFLRTTLVESGVRSAVAVPLLGPRGAVGTLHAYWRSADRKLEPYVHAAERVALLLAAALQAPERSGPILARPVRAVLAEVSAAVGARAAGLVVIDGGPLFLGPPALDCHAHLERANASCPLLGVAGSTSSARRVPGAGACPAARSKGLPTCLPLAETGDVLGVLRLDYREKATRPLDEEVARAVALARRLLVEQEGAARVPGARAGTAEADARTVLRIRCLGALELERDGRRLDARDLALAKARALLGILILAGGRPVRRDVLVQRLWPGVDPGVGANRLHGVVHALRAVVEPRPERPWVHVRGQGDAYYLDRSSPHSVDLFELRTEARLGLQAARLGDADEARRRLEHALALSEGQLFEGEADAEWCTAARDELANLRLEMLGTLAGILRMHGDLEDAVGCLRRALETNPLREDIHQELILLFVELGRRGDAIHQFVECRRVLRSRLGVAPLPATRALLRLANDLGGPGTPTRPKAGRTCTK